MNETQAPTTYAEAMRLHEARLPQTTEQRMLRFDVGIKRSAINEFLRERDLERIGITGKRVNEVSHAEAAHAIIARGGWPAERGFDLLDMIGQPHLKAEYVAEKMDAGYSAEYVANATMYLRAVGGHKW